MFTLIRKNLSLWGYGKGMALFAGCLIFSISNRLNNEIFYEQHILSVVSDHYYLTYFLLPIVLLTVFSFGDDDGELVVLRFQSYHNYFLRKCFGSILIALLLTAIQTVAILLSGVGLSLGNHWSLPVGTTETELFSVLQQFFSTPVQAFAAFTLYQLAGSWLIFSLCMWINHFAKRKWSVRIVVALYIISAVWIKIPTIQNLPFTGLNHLLILHHNLGSPGRLLITGITTLLFALIILVSVRFVWRGHLPHLELHGNGIGSYYFHELVIRQNLLILCIIVLGIMLYKGFGIGSVESGAEWIFVLFAGHGTGYFQVLPFLEMLITVCGPLYLLAVFIERTVKGQSIFISIRSKSRKNLTIGILSASIKFLAVYALLWFIKGFLGAVLMGFQIDLSLCKMLLYAVLLKYLDMLFQYLVMLSVYIFSKQVTIGFLVLIAGNLLCMLPGRWVSYLPFGLSCLTRISLMDSGIGILPVTAFMVEIALSVLFIVWLVTLGYKKILK